MSTERPGHSSLGSQEVIRVSRSQGQKLDGFGNGYRLPSPKLKILPSPKLKNWKLEKKFSLPQNWKLKNWKLEKEAWKGKTSSILTYLLHYPSGNLQKNKLPQSLPSLIHGSSWLLINHNMATVYSFGLWWILTHSVMLRLTVFTLISLSWHTESVLVSPNFSAWLG